MSSNGSTRGRPLYLHSQIRDGQPEPDDEIVGTWPRERLLAMDARSSGRSRNV
jgi:hypothetical protein